LFKLLKLLIVSGLIPGCFFLLLLNGSLVSALAQSGSAIPASVRAEFAPTGTLRAAINYGNPLLATRDPQTGELSGVTVDLARELGRRLGVPVTFVPVDAASKMSDTARSDVWDLAFLGIDPARAQDIDYSAAYIELEGTYLVPAGSSLHTVADVDRDGVRISVTAKSAYDLFLSRTIQHAQLVRAPSTPESVDLFAKQKLDALAAVRTALVTATKRFPGSRVMEGHFMTIPQAAGIPKGRPAAVRYLREFIEEMKASGFVAEGLKRHGLTADDAVVAPAAALQ
jgi:polar amino acid transport system substrate-binding protein